MLTKYAAAAVLSAELVPEAPRHAHHHPMGEQRTFRTAHRHAFVYDKRPGFLYVRSRAISSRCNDNYDEFPAEEIKKGYLSFIGKPVFVNHKNDDHRRARGVVIDAALHEDTNPDGTPDTWVEVLMEVDAVKFPKLAKAILAGEVDRTSMGTDVAYSKCSFCGNKAATPLEYCQHIPKLKGKRIRRRTANGTQEDVLVREICYGLRFFENSLLVEEPADPTAFFLGVEGDGVEVMAKAASKTAVSIADLPRNVKGLVKHEPPVRVTTTRAFTTTQGWGIYMHSEESETIRVPAGATGEAVASWDDPKGGRRYFVTFDASYSSGSSWRTTGGINIAEQFLAFPDGKPDSGAVEQARVQDANRVTKCPASGMSMSEMVAKYGDGGNSRIWNAWTFTCPACGAEDVKQTKKGVGSHKPGSKLAIRRQATICGEYPATDYNPMDCPSWQPYYYASWIKDDGRIMAVTGHDDAPGKQAGAFGRGWVRLMVTNYPSAPYLQAEAHRWPFTPAQASAFRTVADELGANKSIIQITESEVGNGTYTVPTAGLTAFFRQPVPQGSTSGGSMSDFMDRFGSKVGTVCPGCGAHGTMAQALAVRGRCSCGTAIYTIGLKGEPLQAVSFMRVAEEWTPEDEQKHPRKNDGKFAPKGEGESGAGAGGAAPSSASDNKPAEKKLPSEERAKHPRGSKENPVETEDVEEAAKALAEGHFVELKQPKQVSTLLWKLSDMVKAAKAGTGPAVKVNLCNVTVKGTNLFCIESQGIPRIKMPQLKSKKPFKHSRAYQELEPNKDGEYDIQPQFRQMLRDKGVTIEDEMEKATFLKASQNELQGSKIAGMMPWIEGAIKETGKPPIVGEDARIFISNDNYIVDGHHRWAAIVATDWADGQGDELEIDVARIDMDIITLLAEANQFAEEWGFPRQSMEGEYDPEQIAQYGEPGQVAAMLRRLSSKLAYGETKAPANVDTLRDAACPVCGEEQSYDGENCLVCGFVKPPDMFMDPDLEKAQQVDLRQEEDDVLQEGEQPAPGAEKLTCDECGAKFPKEPEAEPAGTTDPAPDEEARTEPARAPGEKVKVEVDDGTEDDEEEIDPETGKPRKKKPPFVKGSAKVATLTAKNLGKARWIEKGRVAGWASPSGAYGVVDEQGRMLSTDGVRPSVWRTLSAAQAQAQYPPPNAQWIEPYNATTAAVDTKAEPPPLKNQNALPHATDNDQKDDKDEPLPETAPQAGDTCPECGKGTLRPDEPAAAKQQEVPGKPEDKKDAPPWAKDDESKEKGQKESSANRSRAATQKEQSMRPALAALADQQKTIEHQARQIQALKQAVQGIARLAGVDQHPKFAALMKIADENNPVQPIPDPPAEAPVETTEEALAPEGKDDPMAIGASPVTDVAADATTDVMTTDVVLDEPLDLNEENVQAPVAGTEGPRPLDEVKTETEVRVGNPNNPDTMFPLQGDFANRATTGSREARTIASLRLARLRIQAGIVAQATDDLSLGTEIAGSNVSDEVIQAEIETLSKVVQSKGRQPSQANRNLVPRSASAQRSVPSLSENFRAPEIEVVSSVSADEILFE